MYWLGGIAHRYTITNTAVHKPSSIGELLNTVAALRVTMLRLGVVGDLLCCD